MRAAIEKDRAAYMLTALIQNAKCCNEPEVAMGSQNPLVKRHNFQNTHTVRLSGQLRTLETFYSNRLHYNPPSVEVHGIL
jgi:hypothetical protein